MRVQVTLPVTVTVDYDTDDISTVNLEELLSTYTAKVVKGMILDLTDDPLVKEIAAGTLKETTGWLVNGLSIYVDDLTLD
jgi:hypothetical protein